MPDDEVLTIAKSRLGRVLRGKYRLDRVLGIGGMAVVYAATHRNKKKFAIKMLHPELSVRENIRTRFLREGYVANSVEHPGAVAVLDDDVAEDGSAFIVMELLDGAPVDEVWSRQGKRLPLGTALAIGDALLDVLVAAHGKKIVHRDLKPANLFLTSDGRLEVLDFGIARLHDETSSEATATGAMLGTPAFMAPEQAMAESTKIDAQTDVWAVGATLFTLLSGEFVHAGVNASQLLIAAGTKPARALASVAKDVPPAVAAVIDRALAFDKAQRWASAQAMREALQQACLEATGAAIAPLPRTEAASALRVTGLEQTEASDEVVRASSSGPRPLSPEFEPTVDAVSGTRSGAPGLAGTGGPTTGAAVASERTPPMPPSRGRIRKRVALGLVTACAVLGGGLLAYRAAIAPRLQYCDDVVMAADGPRCDYELGPESVRMRHGATARVTSRRGRVESVELVNFPGTLDDGQRGFSRLEVLRDEAGAVQTVKVWNRFGVNVQWQKWSDGGRRIAWVDIDGETPRHMTSSSTATQILVDYDAQGRRSRVRFLGPTGRPRDASEDGDKPAFGLALEYGKRGEDPIKVTRLGADGLPASDEDGTAGFRRDDTGHPWATRTHFDVDDHPVLHNGWSSARCEHDAYDWQTLSYFGLHGEPVTSLDEGVHQVRVSWDAAKHIRAWTSLDTGGRPTRVRGGWHSTYRETFDEGGRMVLAEMTDAQGILVNSKNGGAAERFAYDERGAVLRRESLNPAGELTTDISGCAREEFVRDARGRHLEARCFDPSGKAATAHEFGALERESWDDRGMHTGWADFDDQGRPLPDETGAASELRKYDRMRRLVEDTFYGVDGKPVVGTRGYAIERDTYDDNDDLVAEAYFDASGQPLMFKGEYATVRMKRDERGLRIEEAYLDAQGEPALCKEGFATQRSTHDRNGDVVHQEFSGRRGEPILREGGYAASTTKYDPHRRPLEVALLDASGRPVIGTAGWAIERKTYDERGLVVRVDHLDAAGAPAQDKEGRAALTKTYDSRGNVVEETILGADGKPVAAAGGYATKKSVYDDRDELVEESLLGPDGAPVAGKDGWSLRRIHYDDFGDLIEEVFLDAAHNRVPPKDLTYASKRQRFDDRRHLVEAAYLDSSGTPVKGPEGTAIVRYVRDAYGNATQTSYFDGAGAPAASKDGKLVVRSVYDGASRLVDERFVDTAGAPRRAADGCAGHAARYEQGRKVEESCLDVNEGAVAVSTAGWAIRRTLHDARGNDVDVSTYATDGTLHADADGVARRKSRFDERNLLVETAYFDAADRPVRDTHGVHAVRITYDDAGKKTLETRYDLDGKALPTAKPDRH